LSLYEIWIIFQAGANELLSEIKLGTQNHINVTTDIEHKTPVWAEEGMLNGGTQD
jgi:hypothetical protein